MIQLEIANINLLERIKKGQVNFMKKKITAILMVILIGIMAAGCGQQQKTEQTEGTEESASQDIFAMDTYMSVTAYGADAESAVSDAIAEIERLDALLSTGETDSEIYKLNQNGGGSISEDTSYILERALEIWKSTDGCFEIGIYPLMQEWGFTDGNYKVPDKETLQKLLPLADSSKIDFNEKDQTVSFEQDGMEIDFGGIAKGYTSGRIMDIFREHGITSGMVSLGGNVQVLGIKTDGSKWRVAVQNPEDTENYLGVLETQDRAVITSGGYERYFEQDGKTYQHILDPKTGYPADSGLTSVTIVSADGTLADGLSTSLFVMGKEKAVAYWRAHSEEFDAILVEKDGTVSVTENIADQFTPDDAVKKTEIITKHSSRTHVRLGA